MAELFITSQEDVSTYVTVILPLALAKEYTYKIPADMVNLVEVGMRVEVQFGKSRLYAALIYKIHQNKPQEYLPKSILSILDEQPVVTKIQLVFWEWISTYYACTLGDVMNAALPAGLKMGSETSIIISPLFDDDVSKLTDKEFLVFQALDHQNELTVQQIRKLLNQQTVHPLMQSLLNKKVIYLKEELKNVYKPKNVAYVKFCEPYHSDKDSLKFAFEKIDQRATRQLEAIMAFLTLNKKQEAITKKELYEAAGIDSQVLKRLVEKKIFEVYEKEVSRLAGYEDELLDKFELSKQQSEAIQQLSKSFEEKPVALLHGVTGSGKTQVFVHLIEQMIDQGKQVLYLLPEIALTAQIINRLQKHFGDKIVVYHSKFNNNERVEVWKAVLKGKPIVLGARSALFMPFQNLGLIVVDEEHDPSYKQQDPAPRYNARDAAIYLSSITKAKVVLGTATPSLETYYNCKAGKYSLIEMPERFGGLKLPEIKIVDLRAEWKKRKMQSHFSSVLLKELKDALERGEQAILFQNRRGYAPSLSCNACGWNAGCIHCDVGLTYHKFAHNLRCHYCGYAVPMPNACPACGTIQSLKITGFGTEKIEDELKIYLPDANIARMDWDSVKGKNGYESLIGRFEDKQIDVLVGTQMVTKGLDFDNVGIVGVLSADQMLQFPDFRASERAFQLMTQVSGRAGRKYKQGKVIIQAFSIDHPVIKEVTDNLFEELVERELSERKRFVYPPFFKLINIQLKHKKQHILDDAMRFFHKGLLSSLGKRVIGPGVPGVSRVRGMYIKEVMIKMERDAKVMKNAKQLIRKLQEELYAIKGFSTVRITVDVDPY